RSVRHACCHLRDARARHVAETGPQRRVDVDVGVDAGRLALGPDGVAQQGDGPRAGVARADRPEPGKVVRQPGDGRTGARRTTGAQPDAVAVVQDLLDEERVRIGRDLRVDLV